jgi:hypothetical protein
VVQKESAHIFPETPFKFLSLKDCKGSIIQSASRILEGFVITVRKQNLTTRIPQIIVDPSDPGDSPKPFEFSIEFKATTNVRAIKGLVVKSILHHIKLKVDAKKITGKCHDQADHGGR